MPRYPWSIFWPHSEWFYIALPFVLYCDWQTGSSSFKIEAVNTVEQLKKFKISTFMQCELLNKTYDLNCLSLEIPALCQPYFERQEMPRFYQTKPEVWSMTPDQTNFCYSRFYKVQIIFITTTTHTFWLCMSILFAINYLQCRQWTSASIRARSVSILSASNYCQFS